MKNQPRTINEDQELLDSILEEKQASFGQLKAVGISSDEKLGINDHGYKEREIVTIDGSTWRYDEQQDIYELKDQMTLSYINLTSKDFF